MRGGRKGRTVTNTSLSVGTRIHWWPFHFSAFLVTCIFWVIPIIVSFIPFDLGRQESWFGPIDGLFLSFSAFVCHFLLFQHFLVTHIFSLILIIVSFLQVDLGRQEGWFGPKRGVYLGGRLEVSCLPIWDESRKNIESKNLKIKNLE